MLREGSFLTKTNLKELEDALINLDNDLFLIIEDHNKFTNYEEEFLMNIFKDSNDLNRIIELSQQYDIVTEF